MQIGMVGLGRMGANMVQRLMNGKHQCVVFDLNQENVKRLTKKGAAGSASLDAFVKQLKPPRTVWVMVPAGAATEKTIQALAEKLKAGDVVIDGGNTHFKDDVRRAKVLAKKKIHLVDAGTSGDAADSNSTGYHLGGRELAFRSVRNQLNWVHALHSSLFQITEFMISADTA